MAILLRMTSGTLWRRYSVADTIWQIETNSQALFAGAGASFPTEVTDEDAPVDFTMKIVVDDRLRGLVQAAPVFRGRGHLIFAGYGDVGFFALDLRRRVGFAAVSPELAADANYWRESIFPVVLGLLCLVLDAVPLHSACIEHEGRGILIAGASGAGKSTLAATFARMGIAYVSDDWLYLSRRTGRVHAAPVNMKLMPEAIAEYFPELVDRPRTVAMNGEVSVSLDPAAAFHVRRCFSCSPDVVILFERLPQPEVRLRRASPDDLVAFFSEPLDCVPYGFDAERARQIELIKTLSAHPCFVLACGGTPADIAAAVLRVSSGEMEAAPVQPATMPAITPLDLCRRHAATPHYRVGSLGGAIIACHCDFSAPITGMAMAHAGASPELSLDVLLEAASPVPPRVPLFFTHDNVAGYWFGGGGCVMLDATTNSGMAFVPPDCLENGAFAAHLSALLNSRPDVAVDNTGNAIGAAV